MANTALLVADLQNGILDMAFKEKSAADEYLKKAAEAIKFARIAGFKIIYVAIKLRSGYPEISPQNQMFARVATPGNVIFTEGDETSKIHEKVAPQEGDVVVIKKRISAFAGSDLEIVLRSLGIQHIVVAGLSTSGVVLSTVRQAADLDYKITVLEDVVGDSDAEVHEVLVRKVFPRQAEVKTLQAWSSEA